MHFFRKNALGAYPRARVRTPLRRDRLVHTPVAAFVVFGVPVHDDAETAHGGRLSRSR